MEVTNEVTVMNDRKLICPAFCDCQFPSCTDISLYQGPIPELVDCNCGEEDTPGTSWQWHNTSESDVHINGPDIVFHPSYSQGTAIVRGDRPLKAGMVHFWEMRILTALAGTDVMFGIGTDQVNLEQFKFRFVSALGTNSQSWGYSYNGKIQHNDEQSTYGKKFSQGCLVGVYLDRTRGHLEFYLNRRSLGIAYTNIPTDPNINIYPMICSTTAKCAIRLINSSSQIESLQLRAFQVLASQPKILEELRSFRGFRSTILDYWFMAPPVRYSQRSKFNELDILDEVVLSSKTLQGRKRKYTDLDLDESDDDIYANAHKIAKQHIDSDDEEDATPLFESEFDEYFHYLI